jgi:hypothetical protein
MKKISFIIFLLSIAINAQYQFKLPEHFRTKRDLPLIDFPTSVDAILTDFGAIPNDGKDDTDAILKSIEYARKLSLFGSNVKIIFPKGKYDLFTNKNNNHLIEVKNLKNVIIDGNGAEITIHDPLKGFLSIFKSNNIIVKNLFIDYDPLPFTQGKIMAINLEDKTFELKIDEGFPHLNHTMFQESNQVWGMLMDPKIPGKLKDGAPNLFPSKQFEEIEKGLFKVKINAINLLKAMEVGDSYVHIARFNGKSIFSTSFSKNITYLDVTSYASPAGTYQAHNMEEWNVINCKIKLKPGRLHSANADSFHVNGGKFGPWIENGYFEGYSDDAVNLKYAKRNILKQLSPTEIVIKHTLEVNEVIKIFNPRDGELIGTYKVLEAKPDGLPNVKITLDKPINIQLQVGEETNDDVAYVDSQSNESFVIRNNTFRNARRYGILIQATNGLIERNIFENLSQSAITIYNGVDWGEGFTANNIVINQNIFNNCGYDSAYLTDYDAATIKMSVKKLKNKVPNGKWYGVATANWQALENITITNNTFSYNKKAISIESTVNAIIKSNMFIKNSKDLSKESELIYQNNNTNLVFEK